MLIKFKTIRIYDILVALANSWGMFLIIISLGFSLIRFPKTIFKQILTENRVDNLNSEIIIVNKELDEVMITLENNYRVIFNLLAKYKEQDQFRIKLEECAVLIEENISNCFEESLNSPYDEKYIQKIINSSKKMNRLKKLKKET